jgi:hypothetical protein
VHSAWPDVELFERATERNRTRAADVDYARENWVRFANPLVYPIILRNKGGWLCSVSRVRDAHSDRAREEAGPQAQLLRPQRCLAVADLGARAGTWGIKWNTFNHLKPLRLLRRLMSGGWNEQGGIFPEALVGNRTALRRARSDEISLLKDTYEPEDVANKKNPACVLTRANLIAQVV